MDTTTLVTGFAVVVLYGFTFSLTDNLLIILSRSRTDILRQGPVVLVERLSIGDFEFPRGWGSLKETEPIKTNPSPQQPIAVDPPASTSITRNK